MSSEKTKWWKTPPYSNIVGGLTVALILWLVKLGYDWYTVTPILSTVGDGFRYIWDNLISFMKEPIPLWAVLGTFIWYSVIYWLYHRKGRKKKIDESIIKQEKPIPKEIVHTGKKAYAPVALDFDDVPMDVLEKMSKDIERDNDKQKFKTEKMLDYIADEFYDFIWKWNWVYNDLIKKHRIYNIRPCCPRLECKDNDLNLAFKDEERYYKCNICYKTYVIDHPLKEIEKKIEESLSLKELK